MGKAFIQSALAKPRLVSLLLPTSLLVAVLAVVPASAAKGLPHQLVSLSLPGTPSKVIPTDFDGDGFSDLAVVLVYTEYEALSFDRVEGFLQMTEIVPALSERREIRAYLGRPEGGFRLAAPPMELPVEITALSAGPPGIPLVALTGSGASALQLEPGAGGELRFEPLLSEAPVLRGSRTFLPGLEIVRDLDGDEEEDLFFPAREGPAIYRGTRDGFRVAPSDRLTLPGDRQGRGSAPWRRYPLPREEDLNGDGLADLVVEGSGEGFGSGSPGVHLLLGQGKGRFGEPLRLDLKGVSGTGKNGSFSLLQLGDIDGRPGAEVVMSREVDTDRGDMAEAKRPRNRYRIHRLRSDLTVEGEPWSDFEAQGHPFEGDWAGNAAVPFRDLDGDGLKDLVTVNLDFSVFQILRVLTTKKFGIGLEFNILAQRSGGAFEKIDPLKLEDKILLNMDDMKLNRLGNFAGDFDGDGLLEFMTLKGGRTLKIHRGLSGCAYGSRPDFVLKLEEEPADPGLVKIKDLDGDGRADVAVTRFKESDGSGATTPVALDLYLSRGSR